MVVARSACAGFLVGYMKATGERGVVTFGWDGLGE
jgi:hypothetical protein